MITVGLQPDGESARQGMREFARSATDIREASAAFSAAVERLESDFEALRKDLFDGSSGQRQAGSGRAFPALLGASNLAFSEQTTRVNVLRNRFATEEDFAETNKGFPEGDSIDPQKLIDEALEIVDSIGGFLDLLGEIFGEGFEKAARLLGKISTFALPLQILLGPVFRKPSSVEESFQNFNDLNSAIPELERLAEQASGKAKLIFETLVTRFESAAKAEVENILGIFADQRRLINRSESRLGEPERRRALGETVDKLETISRNTVRPEIADTIRSIFEADRGLVERGRKPPVDLPVIPERRPDIPEPRPDSPAIRIDFPGSPDILLQRVGLRAFDVPSFGNASGSLFDSNFQFPGIGGNAFNPMIFQPPQAGPPLFEEFSSSAQRAFEDYANAATNASAQVEGVIGKSLQGAEDALVQFVQTGKLDFKSLADSIIADLIRIAIRAAILGPLANAIGGAFANARIASQAQADIAANPGIFGGGNPIGFAQGGAFTVGGSGGIDSQMVRFRATPGERVTVTRPDRRDEAGGVNLNVQINNEVPEARVSAQAMEGDNGTALRIQIARVIDEDIRSGGQTFRSIRDTFGANPARREVS